MALDRTLALEQIASPPELESAVGDGWALLSPASTVNEWDDIALILRDARRAPSAAVLAKSWEGVADRYALLERHGVLVLSPYREVGNGLLLSGGSYSRVSLHVVGGLPIVRKRLGLDSQLSEDRELRQLREIEWLVSLPAPVAELFAPVLNTVRTDSACELTTGFVAGYTLAELVFQGRLSGRDLADILVDVYSAISAVLWARPPLSLLNDAGESYVRRTRRRIRTILASVYPDDGVVRHLLAAESVIVNGRSCLGVKPLLNLLERDPSWTPVVSPPDRTLCHGDLILEDILIAQDTPYGFSLVDPNPLNESPLYDLGKTMMSLWLGYEFIYFDRFSIDWMVRPDGLLELTIDLADGEAVAAYDEAAERFIAFVERQLLQHLSLPRARLRLSLRMSAAIHMLAITVFHLLHHRRERRALAFFATALRHAQDALDG